MTLQILTETANYYHINLTEEARRYLREDRRLTDETISRFRIGYADGNLYQYLTKEKGFSAEDCIEAGVLRRSEDGKIHDYFFNRIIIPNTVGGKVVHLTGRSLNGVDTKYFHTPGRIDHLFNEDALKNDELIVVEGPFDCMTAAQAGYHAVATMGTSMKKEFTERLSGRDGIYVAMDGDPPGEAAALRIGESIGIRARIVALPTGEDVDAYLRERPTADFAKLLESSRDVITYQLEKIPEDTTPGELTRQLAPVLQLMASLERPLCEVFLKQIRERFGLKTTDISAYRSELTKMRREDRRVSEETPDSEHIKQFSAAFDGLIDLAESDGEVVFVVKDGEDVSACPAVEEGGQILVPPPKGLIPWELPRAKEVMEYCSAYDRENASGIDRQLFEDLVSYHKSISELPDDRYYSLLALWDMHTYLHDKTQYSPIICLFAVPERGKSRTGKGMCYVAHRGIHLESLREAYLLRVGHDLHATAFFDVRDVWKKAERANSDDIILHRFEKGARVPRVNNPDKGPFMDTVYYTVYGPTVIATNEGLHHILDTRCVMINMPEGKKQFTSVVTPEEALELKERLVAFRGVHMDDELPVLEKPAPGRLGDILGPLLQVLRLVCPDREEEFIGLVKDLEAVRMTEKRESREAEILTAIVTLKDEVKGGKLKSTTILDLVNEGKNERQKIGSATLGRRLSSLGFVKTTWSDGSKAIFFDEDKLNRVCEAYGLSHLNNPKDPPVPPRARLDIPED